MVGGVGGLELTMTIAMGMTMTSAFSQRAFAGLDSFGAGTAFVSTGQGVLTSIQSSQSKMVKCCKNYYIFLQLLCQDLRWQL